MAILSMMTQTNVTTEQQNQAHANKLKELDYIASIEHACQRLDLDLKENLFGNDDYLNYFLTIDDKTRIIVEKVKESYLKIDIINQQHKSRMASAVFAHHRLMFQIYFKLIASLAPIKHLQLGMLIGRAINNATEIIKWRYFNFQTAPGNVWLQIANLYDMAEKNQLTDKEIDFYPELKHCDDMPSTIASSYIMINMLGSMESHSLKPQQIDFMSKMLTLWTRNTRVETEYDEHRHLFSANLEKNTPAKRIRNLSQKSTNRFWCMDKINIKIQVLMQRLEMKKTSKSPDMKRLANHLYAHQTLQLIRNEWSLSEYKRQRRAHPRFKTDKTGTNVFGFEDTYYQIKHYEDSLVSIKKHRFSEEIANLEKDIDALTSEKPVVEESMTTFMSLKQGFCNIVDESLNGLCMHVHKKPHELTVGMMLGIAIKENEHQTKIGIIRSVRTIENNMLRIGVEVISRSALSIHGAKIDETNNIVDTSIKTNRTETPPPLSEEDSVQESIQKIIDTHTFGEEQSMFNCLLLPKEFAYKDVDTIILPKQFYQPESKYEVTIGDQQKTIMLTDTFEQHENWVRTGFSELETK